MNHSDVYVIANNIEWSFKLQFQFEFSRKCNHSVSDDEII